MVQSGRVAFGKMEEVLLATVVPACSTACRTIRNAVIEAANQTREARANLIVIIGGGPIPDGAKRCSWRVVSGQNPISL